LSRHERTTRHTEARIAALPPIAETKSTEDVMALRALTPSGNGGTRTAQPVSMFGSLHREIDRLFDDFTRGGFGVMATPAQTNLLPSIDVTETDKEIEITAELPGLERKDVEISVDDDLLTIRGEKKVEVKEEDKGKNYHVAERSYGVFFRAIQLPAGVDPASIQATMSNGVLKVTIPKPAKSEPKKIEVKDAA
jgi:HSP20 family protein